MKRYIKRLINWLFKGENHEDNVACIMGVILGTIVGIITFISIDKVPATPMDYKQLEKQVNDIQQDSDILLKTNCDINIRDEIITVELENENCMITAEYSKNFEILSISKEDKYVFWLTALVQSFCIGIFIWVFGFLISAGLIYSIGDLWKLVYKVLKLNKAKYKKK